ncbi:SSU ribosomal protein S1P [Geoalkalibacter ferrihydriticus]|uniref:Small ribosomal subunit protein bS1 n=2 Tax=Geoalkalibacter ferrihydriticus TaxID=392333 RepID=A0A0C2EDK7_9BACT|nr:30S ribosomal protein S1 [Geoalkalibacter ferrihydriticus]KIH76623.1 30S ribosomal protein S1 [Geoalkalibacter ferrihydriticus DSM 17813]SDM03990.1 SSU ribosomal protein S1P [Geoalkalibacter ferrihydriticus]
MVENKGQFNENEDEFMDGDDELEDAETFAELLDSTHKALKPGEVVKGVVVQKNPDSVVVDVGYKSEGIISLNEFVEDGVAADIGVGSEFDVLFEGTDNETGLVRLSKRKADQQKVWNGLEEDAVVEGRILSRIKGGLSVDIGVNAFLPGSQVDLRPVRNLEKMIGEVFKFKIIKLNKRRGNIVLSRRVLLEDERENMRGKTLENLEEGKVVEGVVKNLTDYGAFIDLGGIDGLLHITDMSWGRVNHPSDILNVGDRINVKILKFDQEKERVSLGLKQITPDPWEEASGKYPVGERVVGKVVSLTDYGAFVELEEGVEGLIHVSEMSWTKRIKHPNKILNIGDEVESLVLAVDADNRRISLGLKQVEPNPWDIIGEKFPVGTIIEGQVKNITDFGIFVGVDEGIDGLVHISDISWIKRIKHPSEVYKKGDTVKAVVLNIDRENERFSLGVKQLAADPWETIPQRYRPGTIVKGQVTSVTDFGIFLEIEEGIEGLIHVSEISKEKVDSPKNFAKVGDDLEAVVLNVDMDDRKIGLSIKKISDQKEKAEVDAYLGSQKEATSSLGALLQGAMSKAAGDKKED